MIGTKITLCIHRSSMGNFVNEVSSLAVIFSIKVNPPDIENFTLILFFFELVNNCPGYNFQFLHFMLALVSNITFVLVAHVSSLYTNIDDFELRRSIRRI